MRILNTIIEIKRETLEKLTELYGTNDPKVIRESQLLDRYIGLVQTYKNDFKIDIQKYNSE